MEQPPYHCPQPVTWQLCCRPLSSCTSWESLYSAVVLVTVCCCWDISTWNSKKITFCWIGSCTSSCDNFKHSRGQNGVSCPACCPRGLLCLQIGHVSRPPKWSFEGALFLYCSFYLLWWWWWCGLHSSCNSSWFNMHLGFQFGYYSYHLMIRATFIMVNKGTISILMISSSTGSGNVTQLLWLLVYLSIRLW